jgi:hypothetical protein
MPQQTNFHIRTCSVRSGLMGIERNLIPMQPNSGVARGYVKYALAYPTCSVCVYIYREIKKSKNVNVERILR